MLPERSSARARWREFLAFSRDVLTRFSEDRVPLAAGAITFFTLLSLVPLLVLAVSLATYFIFPGPEGVARAQAYITNLAVTWGPEIARVLGDQVRALVSNRSLSIVLALLVGFWTGSQIFLILESAMNLTWRAHRRRRYWARRGLALLLVLVVGSLLGLAIGLTQAMRVLAQLPLPAWVIYVRELSLLTHFIISFLIPTLLVAAIFAVMYKVLPTRRVTLRSVLPGALVAAVLWDIALHLFGWYVVHAFARFSVIYGSLGGLVLLMLWFYYSAQVYLLGAEISAVYHQRLAREGDKDEQDADADA